MNAKLNSAQQIADFLGIKVDTLYHYARSGRIRAMKIGKAWKFSDDDLQSFLDSQRSVASGQDPLTATPPPPPATALMIGKSGINSPVGEVPYSQLDTMAGRLAARLQSSGVGPGDRVMVLIGNSIELVASCFAAWKIGAVLVSEDPEAGSRQLEQALHRIAPRALIVERVLWERISEGAKSFPGIKAVLVKGRTFLRANSKEASFESLEVVFNQEFDTQEPRQHLARPRAVMAFAGSI